MDNFVRQNLRVELGKRRKATLLIEGFPRVIENKVHDQHDVVLLGIKTSRRCRLFAQQQIKQAALREREASARKVHTELVLKATSCKEHDTQDKASPTRLDNGDISRRNIMLPLLSSGEPGSFCIRQ